MSDSVRDGARTPPNQPVAVPNADAPPPVAHTPIKKKAAGHGPCAVQNPAMMDRRMELAEETRGMAQGPMPARDFMNEFLPWNDTTPKKFRNLQPSAERLKNLTDMATASEAQTYELFVRSSSTSLDRCLIFAIAQGFLRLALRSQTWRETFQICSMCSSVERQPCHPG